jgi:hypothetical protein
MVQLGDAALLTSRTTGLVKAAVTRDELETKLVLLGGVLDHTWSTDQIVEEIRALTEAAREANASFADLDTTLTRHHADPRVGSHFPRRGRG